MHRLSKSRFLAGWQCPLRLWLEVHRRDLKPAPDAALEAVFATGHRVGELARQRWPGGVLVEEDHTAIPAAIERTHALMADPDVPAIYEAAIVHDDVLTRVDILARSGDAWDLVEVKASTQAKDPFLVDVAVQAWILAGAGVPIRHAGLLLLDRDYVYPGGDYNLAALFRFADATAYCREQFEWIGDQVDRFHGIVARDAPPDVGIGDHCFDPYECPFWAHCSADAAFPEHPITLLPHLRGARLDGLVEQGIETVHQIPDDYPLTANQQRVRTAIINDAPQVGPGLKPALERVAWPLFALDFEAVSLALPRHPGMRPFDQLPFQFSCHVERTPGATIEHSEFLATDDSDPREPLARALLAALGDHGSILVYSGYELRTIRALTEWLPHLADELLALEPRLVDLLPILRAHYTHPEFGGSYSIKQVLPVLIPEMTYEGMEVADGNEAGRIWLEMVAAVDAEERARMEHALRAYCRQDSLAMLRLRERLLQAETAET